MPARGAALESRREGYREKRARCLSQDSINDRGRKEFLQPSVTVRTHDYEIGAALFDLLWNNLSRVPRHNETLDRWACGRIRHEVFETLVQQRIDAIQVM